MSEKRLTHQETIFDTQANGDNFAKSTETTVCAPEFPAGCVDVETDDTQP